MALLPISPTGALSSGDYVSYMIDYLDGAMDDVSDGLVVYLGASQRDGWDDLWDRQVRDLTADIVDLSTRIGKIGPKVRMVSDAISKL